MARDTPVAMGGTAMNEIFRTSAHAVATMVGAPWAFLAAVAVLVGWLATGPSFGFSDTWQLIISTGTRCLVRHA